MAKIKVWIVSWENYEYLVVFASKKLAKKYANEHPAIPPPIMTCSAFSFIKITFGRKKFLDFSPTLQGK